jgi:hypothetical protein
MRRGKLLRNQLEGIARKKVSIKAEFKIQLRKLQS